MNAKLGEVSTKMETLILRAEEAATWKVPSFQRPLHVNAKVRALAELLKLNGGIMPGVITLGILPEGGSLHIADGQHRREAFLLSGLRECIADVRTCVFDSLAEMAQEFVNLNSSLVRMRPDDLLRGLESSSAALTLIRERCPFVGYGNIRRNNTGASPMLGMSSALRAWVGSASETPTPNGAGKSAAQLASDIDQIDAERLAAFLNCAHQAWGNDRETFRLWAALNLTVTMWLWRRLVLDQERGVKRAICLTADQFKKCLMSVSAEKDYLDWLTGRVMGDRDRSSCFNRLKAIFQRRLLADSHGPRRVLLPAPIWAAS